MTRMTRVACLNLADVAADIASLAVDARYGDRTERNAALATISELARVLGHALLDAADDLEGDGVMIVGTEPDPFDGLPR